MHWKKLIAFILILAAVVVGGWAFWKYVIDKDAKAPDETSKSSSSAEAASDNGVLIDLAPEKMTTMTKNKVHRQPMQQQPPLQAPVCKAGEFVFMNVVCIDVQSAEELSRADSIEDKMKIIRKLLLRTYGNKHASKYEGMILNQLQLEEDGEDVQRHVNRRAVFVGKNCDDSDGVDQILDEDHWAMWPEMPGYDCGMDAVVGKGRYDPNDRMKPAPVEAFESDELEQDMKLNLKRSQQVMDQIGYGRRKAQLNRKLLRAMKGVKGRQAAETRRILEAGAFAPQDVSEGMTIEELNRKALDFQLTTQLMPREHSGISKDVHANETLNRSAADQDVHHAESRRRAIQEAKDSDTAQVSHSAMMEISRSLRR